MSLRRGRVHVAFRWWGWVAAAACAIWLTVATRAHAWNPHGHMVIALLAYDALPPARRSALVALLKEHPRFHEDLLSALPRELSSKAERERWLFAYASTWPDIARSQPAFHRGTWHYVNLPLTLRGDRLATCQAARRDLPASVRRLSALDAARRARGEPGIPLGDSITTALETQARVLGSGAPASERAVALSWILHLVGDVHQPLHAVALFNGGRFEAGDRGGNDIVLPDQRSLHQVWDELLGAGTSPNVLDATLAELRRQPRPGLTRGAARQGDVNRWVEESCELARRSVYLPEVLAAVRRLERGGRARPSAGGAGSDDRPVVALGGAQLRQAAEQARGRALLAGLRLAALLENSPLAATR